MLRILVVGGSGAVGSKIVEELAHRGHDVTFTFFSGDRRARELAERTGATPIYLDLCDIRLDDGRIPPEAIINSAGINVSRKLVHEVTPADLRRTFEINFFGPLRILNWALPAMIGRNFGRIVNIGSIYSIRGSSRNGPYTSSKHALSGLTKTIALEYGPSGIAASEVLPGPIDSPLLDEIITVRADQTAVTPQMYKSKIINEIPSRHLLSAHDVARAAVFLVEDPTGQFNGSSLIVDGGLTI